MRVMSAATSRRGGRRLSCKTVRKRGVAVNFDNRNSNGDGSMVVAVATHCRVYGNQRAVCNQDIRQVASPSEIFAAESVSVAEHEVTDEDSAQSFARRPRQSRGMMMMAAEFMDCLLGHRLSPRDEFLHEKRPSFLAEIRF